MFQEWIEIAKVTRSSEFEESEDQEIDIYEIQVHHLLMLRYILKFIILMVILEVFYWLE